MTQEITARQAIDLVEATLKEANVHYGHGTDNPFDEATALVFQGLGLNFDRMEVLDDTLSKEQYAKIMELLDQRIKNRIPLAYLTHEAYFFGIPFYVDERVIIPRSSIGELIDQHFTPWINPEKVNRILDLCTGSGCLAIAAAIAFEYAAVDAVDLSEDALAVAKINVEKHQMQNQVHLIQSDLFHSLQTHRYDIIISNPPYVSREEIDTLPPEYHHEPDMAFYSDDNGLDLTIRILKQAKYFLNDHGILVVEVGNSETLLQERFPHVPFIWLTFEEGEGGVFLLSKADLEAHF